MKVVINRNNSMDFKESLPKEKKLTPTKVSMINEVIRELNKELEEHKKKLNKAGISEENYKYLQKEIKRIQREVNAEVAKKVAENQDSIKTLK